MSLHSEEFLLPHLFTSHYASLNDARPADHALSHTALPIYPSSVHESPTTPEKIFGASLLPVFPPLAPSAISRQIQSSGESVACARTEISETTRRTPPAPRPPRKRRYANILSRISVRS